MGDLLEQARRNLEQHPEMAAELFYETQQFEELMMMYECAIKEVRTKLEVLDAEFSVRYRRNPISSIESRVKSPMSIFRKLKKSDLQVSAKTITRDLNDVAGIRVICNFIDDIYTVAKLLSKQDDVKVVQVKDYIRNPKENGYRSYHMIIEIPVFFSQSKRMMRVEIQLRTIAMNFWASLEHQIRYKKDLGGMSGDDMKRIAEELKEASDTIALTDEKMQRIKEHIDLYQDSDAKVTELP